MLLKVQEPPFEPMITIILLTPATSAWSFLPFVYLITMLKLFVNILFKSINIFYELPGKKHLRK